MKKICWTKTIMNQLGWVNTSSVSTHSEVDAACNAMAAKYPKAKSEIESSRVVLHDSIDHPAKY